MKVFIFPGKIPPETMASFLPKIKSEVCGIMIRDPEKIKKWQSIFPNTDVYLKTQLDNVSSRFQHRYAHKFYFRILKEIISMPQTIYLSDRVYGQNYLNNTFNSLIKLECAVWNSISIIDKNSPEKIVFQATPHHIHTWIFSQVAEKMGIPVFFTAGTFLNWKTKVVQGVHDQIHVHSLANTKIGMMSEQASQFLMEKTGNYNNAIPDYELEREKRFKGKYWNLSQEVKFLRKNSYKLYPFKIYDIIRKRRCLHFYNNISISEIPDQPYVIYFLHYQPERTSIPEGDFFGQQLFAISLLSFTLKKLNITLLVKEHPSTFRQPWQPNFRSIEFYEAINSMENVKILSLTVDPFKLIDSSLATSTISGTVIFESLCRERPVLIFGPDPNLRELGIFKVNSGEDIEDALISIINGAFKINTQLIENYVAFIESTSFDKQKDINTSIEAYIYAVNYQA